jgi:hypothetical protein
VQTQISPLQIVFLPDLVAAVLDGVPVRRSLDLTSWEAANRTTVAHLCQ